MNKVVCSGYFNPLHTGHIECVKQASKLGKLIVIVNNDKQVALKGSISFQNEDERRDIVDSIQYVSYAKIAIDDDESVANTLILLRPDIFFNAGDRNLENINKKEQEICDSIGTLMVYGTSPKVQSSSELIEKAAREWIKKQ